MSEFFRIPANTALMFHGLTTLARLSHEAEDTSNDILLMQVAAEVESREKENAGAEYIFRQEYIRLHREDSAKRKGKR